VTEYDDVIIYGRYNAEIRVKGYLVRRGMEGRVLDENGSAGDYPIGYTSEFRDKEAALKWNGRGARPRKVIRIYEPAAEHHGGALGSLAG
jgi:hypothetical protein